MLRTILTASVSAAVIALSGGAATAQTAISIGASGSGSVFYTLAVGLSRVIQDHADINATVESVGGSHANIFALANGDVDMAIVNGLAAIDGYRGREPFLDMVDVRLVAQGHSSLRQVFVRRASDIETVADLAGSTWITAMPANPDIAEISAAYMAAAGLSEGDVRAVSMTETAEAVSGFESGTIDAATMPASAGAPHITRLFDSETIDYLYIDDETAAAIAPSLPEGMTVETLPAGTYPNQGQDATVFSIRTYLVASADVPDDVIEAVAAALFDNPDDFAQYHNSAREWTLENTLDRPALPFHSGVVSFLEDRDLWTDELEALQSGQ